MKTRNLTSLSRSLLGGALALLALAAATPKLAAQHVNGQAASSVLGQPNFSSTFGSVPPTAASLNAPGGIAVDPVSGSVFVADTNNSRILRYASATALQTGTPAVGVLGQPDFGSLTVNTTQTGMRNPTGLFVDFSGRLWVADTGNNRVLWFNSAAALANGAAASGRLGQTDYTSMGAALSQSRFNAPRAVLVDSAKNLWIADSGNSRVLKFNNAVDSAGAMNLSPGASASVVLGQPDFVSGNAATTKQWLNKPAGLAFDAAGHLWVADTGNNRVVSFANAASISANLPIISLIFGQSSVIANAPGTAKDKLDQPEGLLVDSRGHLYVADRVNNRVMVYRTAASKPTYSGADAVIGATGFADSFGGSTAATFRNPVALAITTADQLFVADRLNNRVLRFAPVSLPVLHSNASSVKLRPKRKRTVVYTLTNTNYPGAYRYSVSGSNRSYSVKVPSAAKNATPLLAVGGSHKLAVTLKGKKKSKKATPLNVSARAISAPNRSAEKATQVSVK